MDYLITTGRPPVPWIPPVRCRSFAAGWPAVSARTLAADGKCCHRFWSRPARPPTGYTHTARGRRPGVTTVQPPLAGTFVTGAAAGMTRRAAGDCRPGRRSTSSGGPLHREVKLRHFCTKTGNITASFIFYASFTCCPGSGSARGAPPHHNRPPRAQSSSRAFAAAPADPLPACRPPAAAWHWR